MATPKQIEDIFKRGDKVHLLSGGPNMMVMGPERHNDLLTGKVECIWFLRRDDMWEGPFEAAFYPQLLEEGQDEDWKNS